MPKYKVTLISQGEIIRDLHFGPYAKEWWVSRPTNNDVEHMILYPDGFEPRYLCQSGSLQSNTCKSSSEAVTYIYQQAFFTKVRLDGLLVMGFDDPEI
ncbi:10783_t:CDS:2, partial [Gigaspora rosea]